MEILSQKKLNQGQIKSAIFDFDGTLSTLRFGWEKVMEPMMIELIGGEKHQNNSDLRKMIIDYIDESTGIQTVYQMRWLAEKVAEWNPGISVQDEWWYKDEYNRRLMEMVSGRLKKLESGEVLPENFLMAGSKKFLQALYSRGIELCVASGTDHDDVVKEVHTLGLTDYFNSIMGAPARKAACSKEAVIRMILEERGYQGDELLLVGDGKVEIALGAENGAYALGVASDEAVRHGINPVKRTRLVKAGADMIIGDFSDLDELLQRLGI